jgi:hypothetical protein
MLIHRLMHPDRGWALASEQEQAGALLLAHAIIDLRDMARRGGDGG